MYYLCFSNKLFLLQQLWVTNEERVIYSIFVIMYVTKLSGPASYKEPIVGTFLRTGAF